ncbi:ABC transporter ATP-binding protein [Candidatus Woesearchaeota archaeon]|nr:ABC transporter ATP-binding protein [Candidatus Woesearchaeota archaeon]
MRRAEQETALLNNGWPEELVKQYLDNTYRGFSGALNVNAIEKSFTGKRIIENLSFMVCSGEIFGIVGPSGCGKTTLLNIIIGFLKPDKGTVTISREAVEIPVQNARSFFGLSTQTPSVYPNLTVMENLMHFASLYNLPRSEARRNADKLISIVNLQESRDTLAQNLSGGMLKRLDIACALINNPNILILDEPTSGLDEKLRKEVWNLIKSINNLGTTILVASHFVTEMTKICDRILRIQNGKGKEIDPRESYKISVETKTNKNITITTKKPIQELKTITEKVNDADIVQLTLMPDMGEKE